MKLAAKQVELSLCPHVSESSKSQLAESAAPPIRLVTLKANGNEVKAGNEVVLFRHEKTFYHKPGLFVSLSDLQELEELKAVAKEVDEYTVGYVGIDLKMDGFAIEAASGDAARFQTAVGAVRSVSSLPLILIAQDPDVMSAGLLAVDGEAPLLYGANPANWEAMAKLASQHKTPLAVIAPTLEGLAELTEKVKGAGVEDMVLDHTCRELGSALVLNTQIRRMALKKNFRALGYPTISFPKDTSGAAQSIAKYDGFIVLEKFAQEIAYPLLVLRQNVYTDPQKPIQVQPGLYEINKPTPEDPVLVTTNFSITYFSVANEVEGSGLPAWLLVTDAEGMSVLTAWAAGKFDAERIAKAVKTFSVAEKVSRKRLVLPGHVAVLSGEVEGELPDWEVRVGPRESVDIKGFMKSAL
jgi:acetyl-CoA decarbonylase/synthase, CODH/ACS complex subunit gamma